MKFIVLMLFSLLLPFSGFAAGSDVPSTPFVKIASEMHTARIQSAASDGEGKLLATVSADKSVKIWERKTGKLTRTVRPPIADGIEGQLLAVALSPDGKTVATGGFTGQTWDKKYSVYLFDIASGAMTFRIGGFAKQILSLAFSRDGKCLAAGFGGGGGLSVHSASAGALIFQDKAFRGNVYGIDYDSRGNLIATSDQGDIKYFHPDGTLAYALHSEHGVQIYSVRFSPDGSLLALGYDDSPAVEVREALDGSVAFEASDPKGKRARFSSVAWSADGSRILAAGSRRNKDSNQLICVWSSRWKTFKERIEVPVKASITQLLSFGDGTSLFLSRQDGFGLLDAPGNVTYFKAVDHPDFQKNHDFFRISADASVVKFSYQRHGEAQATFDLKARKLAIGKSEEMEFLPARFTGTGIDVRNWDNAAQPRLGKRKLMGLYARETSHSLAVQHDNQGFVLGTTYALRSYDRQGKQLWVRRIPTAAWDLALSADDRTLVAALDDGTIRWFNAKSGEEQYALYLHPDRKRWVLWLPSGYFDHAPDSERLIGFQVNQGKEREAAFVRISQMYDLFYRPDVVQRAVAGEDISVWLKHLTVLPRSTPAAAEDGVAGEAERVALEKAALDKAALDKAALDKAALDKAIIAERLAAEASRLAQQQAAEEKSAQELAALSDPPTDEDEEDSSDDDLAATDGPVVPGGLLPVVQQTVLDQVVNLSTLPPKVRFITQSGTAQDHDVKLVAELCDSGGGIGGVTMFLNGMPVVVERGDRGVAIRGKSTPSIPACVNLERTITLANDKNVISITAFNKNNTIESLRNTIELNLPHRELAKPRLYILTVAIDNYRDLDLRLKYPVADATDLEKITIERAKPLFADILSFRLHDADVTRDKIEEMFSRIGSQMKREDVFLFFLAGHGITEERDGVYYFLPVDFRYTDQESIARQGISLTDFKRYLAGIQAMKSLILLDTCNSGSFVEGLASRGLTEKTALTKLARSVGRATIAASSKNQAALEGYQGHGVFSFAVLEGIRGKAANRQGEITINHLASFIEETLPGLTFKKWGYEQVPQKSLVGNDFPFGMTQ
jgi:WD40 repeat protein